MASKTKITYRQVGDYKIPNIILPPEQANITLGKWEIMHKDYLEHNKRGLFMLMVTKCTLWPYLADIDRQANEMYDLLIEQMKETEGVTELLKEENQLEWVQRTGRYIIRNRFELPKEDNNAIDILLFTEVGSEGLDYQFCNMMINYDLPY